MMCEANGMAETQEGPLRIEPCHKRVRGYIAGEVVVDTINSKLVWEHNAYPAYYFPDADVRIDQLPAGSFRRCDGELEGLVRIEWRALDEWLEEDEPVYVPPRNPHSPVHFPASPRHVEVKVDGVTVADTRRPVLLFETGLPPRYYIPLPDVRLDLMQPTDRETMCPYKGTATYWSLTVNGSTYPNFVWCYRAPLPE